MRRLIIALLVGIIAGYWLGYYDAYRGEKAIGSRIRIAVGMATPEALSAESARRAAVIRDSMRSKSGLVAVDSAVGTLP